MRTLSAGLLAELGLSVTRPGYLVKINFSTPIYLSSLGDIVWSTQSWAAADIKISGLRKDEKGGQSGTLTIGNTYGDVGVLALAEGVADRQIQIWSIWAGAIEPILEFDGAGDGCEIGDTLRIALASQSIKALFSPRRYINAASGFTTLLPNGTKVKIGNQTVTLER